MTLLDRLAVPIVQAPMAGGVSTPELALAVGAAGGLGFLAAGYRDAGAVEADMQRLRTEGRAPFGVNVFVPGEAVSDRAPVLAYVATLAVEAARAGVAVGEPRFDDDDWHAKIAMLTRSPVAVVSFTFGCPPPAVVAMLHSRGSEVWVTVCDVGDARVAADRGADVLVVQGSEAGGHRSSSVDDDREQLSLIPLLRMIRSATDLPLVAAGGICDGGALAAALAAGAAAGQLGTAFLRSVEAATEPVHRDAAATATPTRMTRAFTGRLARGLQNRFMDEHSRQAPSAYPEIHHATAPLRAAARRAGDAGGFNLWAGQGHELAPALPASEIVRRFATEARAALREAAARVAPDRPAAHRDT